MSDYNCIRFKGIIKEQFRKNFTEIAYRGKWYEHEDPKLREFGEEYYRSEFIPTGLVVYAPDSWTTKPNINGVTQALDGFETYFNEETGEWNFQCQLKIDKTPDVFFYEIVPYICESLIYGELVDEFHVGYSYIYRMDPDGNVTEEEVKHDSNKISLYKYLQENKKEV